MILIDQWRISSAFAFSRALLSNVAVGWLARENKICKDGELYRLDATNLTFEIGGNAGKIWYVLNTEKKVNIPHIMKLTQMNKREACSALGWLARENKVQLNIRR